MSTSPAGVVIDEREALNADGARITLIRFRRGQVRFALHDGTEDPPAGGAALGATGQPVIDPSERPVLVGAFNGGFKAAAGAGGVEINGDVITSLVFGMASLVIDADGTAHIGVWGQGVPSASETVTSVRQNLSPLVVASQPSPSIDAIEAWGSTLRGVAFQARSAVGEDAAGDLIYAASMGSLPADVAAALISAGSVIGMELDINPEWVQADVASQPGGALVALVPGQTRPADQYLVGWTRDFITVDAS